MKKSVTKLRDPGFRVRNYVLVNFHISHGVVLLFEPALEARLAPPEQQQLVKASAAVTQLAAQKKHS